MSRRMPVHFNTVSSSCRCQTLSQVRDTRRISGAIFQVYTIVSTNRRPQLVISVASMWVLRYKGQLHADIHPLHGTAAKNRATKQSGKQASKQASKHTSQKASETSAASKRTSKQESKHTSKEASKGS